jgi:ornithine cyclodeaminase
MRRSTVVVESRAMALREAGDVIQAGLAEDDLVTIDALVRGEARPAPDRPRVFKSTGMSWEDLVVAAAVHERR